MPDELLALSPLDGRYADETQPLREHFSEYALIRGRVMVEIEYLIALCQDAGIIRPIPPEEIERLKQLAENFSIQDARANKDFERITRHDVKAVESFLRARLAPTPLSDLVEYLHFGLTSEDVNNIATAISLRESRDRVLLPELDAIVRLLEAMVRDHKSTPMLARTHGQAAVPTTFGKELAVPLLRLQKQRAKLANHRFEAKLNGAVGNFNALAAAAPHVDWPAFSERFIQQHGLQPAVATTQILPYDNWLDYFAILMRINSVLISFAEDIWQYASIGYIKVKAKPTEIGSSTMPQKVNPIDFENAEGNLGMANATLEHYARKLPISRLQRDLSDSTVRRTFGTALGHSLVAYKSLRRGLELLEPDPAAMKTDLEAHWEVVAEGAQTILRTAGVGNPYDLLKELTRGKRLSEIDYHDWIDSLQVEEGVKERLHTLSPLTYTGLAEKIAERALHSQQDQQDIEAEE